MLCSTEQSRVRVSHARSRRGPEAVQRAHSWVSKSKRTIVAVCCGGVGSARGAGTWSPATHWTAR
jgi:hypothetical protein